MKRKVINVEKFEHYTICEYADGTTAKVWRLPPGVEWVHLATGRATYTYEGGVDITVPYTEESHE